MAEEVVLVGVTRDILKKLVSFLAGEINLAWGMKGDLEELGKKLTLVQALLHDAEQRGVEERFVRVWLENVKRVAHDAEDVVDEFAYEILQKRIRNKVRNFFTISNPLSFRFKMAPKVSNINIKLEKIVGEANQYKLRPVESIDMTTNRKQFRLTHPFIKDSEIVGRNDDTEKVVDMLLKSDNEEDLSVIAIVGVAGLGKTTLAKLVYKNETVMRHFDKSVWVCVSDDFDVERLLKEVVESLTGKRCDMSNIEAIIKELRKNLNGGKYLLVLDDVWNTNLEKWECMRNSLLGIGASKGSKIMVTSRSDEVVSIMHSLFIHRLAILSNDDGRNLFEQRAFASGGPKKTSNLVDIGRRIVERCGGLPLAIKTLGSLMHSRKEEKEWLLIEKCKIWELREGASEIIPILRLSFDHLPSPSLKQCFAYCSIFPRDSRIWKEDLIQRWMAQGFLQPPQESNLEMEDVGDDYFKILLWNSFFQDVERDEFGNITGCKIHDLVHDLAASISRSQCLSLSSKEVDDNLKARHLLLTLSDGKRRTIPPEIARKMRTLILRDDVLDNSLLSFKCLRVLNLKEAFIAELPTSIGKLKHLRYLDISSTGIEKFPKSICKLFNLQTLRFMNCIKIKELPSNFTNLINLRHIYFGNMSSFGFGHPEPCSPIKMGRLTCLQTLPYFVVGSEKGHQIEELGCLNKLRGKLIILNLEHVRNKEAALRANLLEKINIDEVGLIWSHERDGDNINDEDVLEGLQPQPNLKSLSILNYGGHKLPSWMTSGLLIHDNLVEIYLRDCNRCEQVPTLGQVPTLRVLRIHGMGNVKHIGAEFYGYGNDGEIGSETTRALFPALKYFSLRRMSNLEEWMEAAARVVAFPLLKRLFIEECPRLTTAGVVAFPLLEELSIKECPRLTTAGVVAFPLLKKLSIKECPRFRLTTAGVVAFPLLEELSIECPRLTTVPNCHISSLMELSISGVDSHMPLTNISSNTTTLTYLRIANVSESSSMWEGLLKNNKNIKSLTIENCPASTDIAPHGWACCTSLRLLNISSCENLSHISDGLRTLTSLVGLCINRCPNLISIPEDIRELRCLSILSISYCGKLKCFPKGLDCLTRLGMLSIGPLSTELHSFPSFEGNLQLQELSLWGWPNLNSLPDELQHLTALTSLNINNFDGVEALPEWFGNLSSLQRLTIWSCKNLKHLPPTEAMRRLTKLRELDIRNCPLLEKRCTPWHGREWSKISHIPRIEIDFVPIRSQPAWRLRFLIRGVLRDVGFTPRH